MFYDSSPLKYLIYEVVDVFSFQKQENLFIKKKLQANVIEKFHKIVQSVYTIIINLKMFGYILWFVQCNKNCFFVVVVIVKLYKKY